MFKLFYDAAVLNLEAQHVMWLRAMRIAKGGETAKIEARRMVADKVIAFRQAIGQTATGTRPKKIMRDVRKIVSANRRHLSK